MSDLVEVIQPWIAEAPCAACDHGKVYRDAPWLCEPEACEDCGGSGVITRNYLREALQLAGGVSNVEARREHVQAVIAFYRQFASAIVTEEAA